MLGRPIDRPNAQTQTQIRTRRQRQRMERTQAVTKRQRPTKQRRMELMRCGRRSEGGKDGRECGAWWMKVWGAINRRERVIYIEEAKKAGIREGMTTVGREEGRKVKMNEVKKGVWMEGKINGWINEGRKYKRNKTEQESMRKCDRRLQIFVSILGSLYMEIKCTHWQCTRPYGPDPSGSFPVNWSDVCRFMPH